MDKLFLTIAGESYQFGRGSFPVDDNTLKCKNFTFTSSFTSDDVHVHITINNESPENSVTRPRWAGSRI